MDCPRDCLRVQSDFLPAVYEPSVLRLRQLRSVYAGSSPVHHGAWTPQQIIGIFTEKTRSKKSREPWKHRTEAGVIGKRSSAPFSPCSHGTGATWSRSLLVFPFIFPFSSSSPPTQEALPCRIISVILPIPPTKCFQVTNSPRVARVSRKVMNVWKIPAYSPGSNVHGFDRGCKPTRPHAAQRL